MLYAISTLVLLIIAAGVYFRRQRKVHLALMTLAFLIDLGLVLVIELNRHAVETALSGPEGLLLFHIIVSTLVLVLYIAQIISGIQWLKNNPRAVLWHRYLAVAFLLLRLTNYVTSFFIGSPAA